MKKFAILLFYSFFLLLLGRNLTFLPSFNAADKSSSLKPAINLREDIKNLTSEFEGDYSIYYEDLKTGEAFGIDHNTVLTAASLNKLPIVLYLYHLAEKKEIDLEEKIVLQKEDIQDYGTGVLRYEEPGGVYTLKKLSELAFKNSDNTAAHLLTIRLGESNIQAYVNSLGMSATNIAFNETSPRDIGLLLSLLYEDKLTSVALKKELFDYLSDTQFEDRIPRYIKDRAKIYHKIGDSDNMVHDAGIIDDGKNPFILVVMTQGIVDEEKARDSIGKIAKEIYDKR